MAGRSIIEQSKDRALSSLRNAAASKENFELARQQLYALYQAATQRRSAYASNKPKRELIRATQEASWQLVEAMDYALEHWAAVKSPTQLVLPVVLAVRYIDGTPSGIGEYPTPDTITGAAHVAVARMMAVLPERQRDPQLPDVAAPIEDTEDKLD